MPRSPLMLLQPRRATNKTAVKRESGFYQQMKTGIKKTKRNLILTRLETWATPGIPDLIICDENGKFHFIELKYTATKAVQISPHQVAWLSKHKHSSSWIFIKRDFCKENTSFIIIYKAEDAIDLKLQGLKKPPFYCEEEPFDWHEILSLTIF